MLSTNDAIVLTLQPHTDKAHILHAYTRAGGRVNYRVYGLMSRKKNIGLYTPLSLLQITADYPQNGLPTIREAVSLAAKRTNCEADLYKQTVSMFVAEVLFHVLRHPMPDEPMFDYIAQAIQTLNETDEPQNFHLQFLIGLADKLGFKMPTEPAMPHTRTERQKVLKDLCRYFEEHVETWQTPRSLDVLIEVFN